MDTKESSSKFEKVPSTQDIVQEAQEVQEVQEIQDVEKVEEEKEVSETFRTRRTLAESVYEFPYCEHDERDVSVHPSYTKFKIPYHIVCARRYMRTRLTYQEQFENEIRQLIQYMDSGSAAVAFGRHIAYTSLWPPLHSRTEIKNTEQFFRLRGKQAERLNYLMENIIN